jgi:UDP-N-acetyl-D-glucosamine dehydrogenase
MMSSVPLSDERLEMSDCVIITADHQSVDWERVGEKASTIVDSRNAMASVEGVTASVYKI